MRLHYNLTTTVLDTDIDDNDTAIDLTAALQEGGANIPTFASPDTLDLSIGPPGGMPTEVVTVTAYTAGDTTAIPISRGTGDTLAVAHAAGSLISNAPTKADFFAGAGPQYVITTDTGTQSLSTGATAVITNAVLDDETDPQSFASFDNALDLVEIIEAGWFRIDALLSGDGTTLTGFLELIVRVDQDGFIYELPRNFFPFLSDNADAGASGILWLDVGWTVQLLARQETGDPVNLYYAYVGLQRLSG